MTTRATTIFCQFVCTKHGVVAIEYNDPIPPFNESDRTRREQLKYCIGHFCELEYLPKNHLTPKRPGRPDYFAIALSKANSDILDKLEAS